MTDQQRKYLVKEMKTMGDIIDFMESYVGNPGVFEEDFSDWELRFHEKYGSLEGQRVLFQMQLESKTVSERMRYQARWKAGFFESVVDHFVVIDIAVPVCYTLPVFDGRPFAVDLRQQPEQIQGTPGLGSFGDMTMSEMALWQTNTGDEMVAIRAKLNGTPMYRVTPTQMMSAWWVIEVPVNHPVRLAEVMSHRVYVLVPYGVRSGRYDGIYYQEHPWHNVSEMNEIVDDSSEGLMILTSQGERRCKWYPTVEIQMDETRSGLLGVWECRRLDTGVVEPIRPRPGKIPSYLSFFDTFPSLKVWKLPVMKRTVIEVQDGDYAGPWHDDGYVVKIDSGIRWKNGSYIRYDVAKSIPSHVVDDVTTYVTPKGNVRVPTVLRDVDPQDIMRQHHIFCGVKAHVLTQDGSIAVISDEGKPLDYIGGGINDMESSASALLREIYEETGIHYMGKLVPIGISTGVDAHYYHSFMYLIDSPEILRHPKMRFIKESGRNCATHFKRLLDYVVDKTKSNPRVVFDSFSKVQVQGSHGCAGPTIRINSDGCSMVQKLKHVWVMGKHVNPSQLMEQEMAVSRYVGGQVGPLSVVAARGVGALLFVNWYYDNYDHSSLMPLYHVYDAYREWIQTKVDAGGTYELSLAAFFSRLSLVLSSFDIEGVILPVTTSPFLRSSIDMPVQGGGYDFQEKMMIVQESKKFSY